MRGRVGVRVCVFEWVASKIIKFTGTHIDVTHTHPSSLSRNGRLTTAFTQKYSIEIDI